MNKFHIRKDIAPSHLARNNTGIRHYDKKFKEQVIKTIADCRTIGLTWEEIRHELNCMYALEGDISTFRKEYTALANKGQITTYVDSQKSIDLIAKAKNKILIDRKINTKQRNLLNFETNAIAYKEMIREILSKWEYESIPLCSKVAKNPLKMLNRAVYLVADEHYKGEIDKNHLISMFSKIKEDIELNKLEDVEIWFLGDGVDGLIHTGSLSSNEGAIRPTIQYANIITSCINQIPQVKKVLYVDKSNHTQTRPLNSNRNELAEEDLGLIISEMLKIGLRKDIILEHNDIITTKYNDLDIVLLHGHQPYTKSKSKMVEYWSSKYKVVPDIIIMGHYHQFKVSEYGRNKWLVVLPTAKQFNGDYEKANGYISYSQFTKMVIKNKAPIFEIINIKE